MEIDFWQVHYHHQWKWFEVVPFMALGIAGGLVGAVPPSGVEFRANLKSNLPRMPYFRGGFCTGVDLRNHPFAPELPPPCKWFEVVPFMALGIAGGLVGAVSPTS